MIPEKVTWVQFLARINTVCSKLLPMNNLFFQYLIKHSYIFALMNFLTEYQITKYVQLCCISFATFFEFFHFFFYAVKCLLTVALALKQLTLFGMGFFEAVYGWGPFPKICHTYPTMMKLGTVMPYLKKIQKIYESRDTLLDFCSYQYFFTGISKFCYIKKYRYRLHFDT